MKKNPLKLLLTVVILITAGIVLYDLLLPRMAVNYKVTVEIETPEGVKSSYAVRQVESYIHPLLFSWASTPLFLSGDAVVIDLGERGTVFALLPEQLRQNGLYQAFPFEGSRRGKIRYHRSLKTGAKAPWHEYTPRFVMFRDIADPLSVTLVRSGGQWNDEAGQVSVDDHFEAVYGQGVRLKSIEIEITDEAVSKSDGLPTWLPEYYKKSFDGNRYVKTDAAHKLANSLTSYAFSADRMK